jgi:hypothetical protein
LNAKVGEHALRPEFGGKCTAPHIDGKLLVEFMHLFDKQFERKFKVKNQKFKQIQYNFFGYLFFSHVIRWIQYRI